MLKGFCFRIRGQSDLAASFKAAYQNTINTTFENIGLCFQYLLDTSNKHFHPEINTE
jgi:hypothetical protein